MHSFRSRYARILIAVSLTAGLILSGGWPTAATHAQVGSETQVDPACDPVLLTCNTYEFGGNWVVDPNTTSAGAGGYFAVTHQALANTSFAYFETPWVENHIPDNESLVQGFAQATLIQLGLADPSPVAAGSLADGTLWHLYAAPIEGVNTGMLFAADTADPSQNDVMIILTSPADTFDQALTAVQSDIRVNGVNPLEGIDPAQAMAALQGGAVVTPAAETSPTPATTPTVPPSATSPSGQAGQSLTIGADTLTFTADWQIDPENTAEGQAATFEYVLDPRILFSYLQGADRESGGNIQVALQILDGPAIMGADNAQELASEVLPNGSAYELYTWEREGAAETALFLIDVTTTPGTLRVQILLAPPELFLGSFDAVQQSFQINGEPVFGELDLSVLAGLLGDTPAIASTFPASTGAVTETTPTPTAGGSVDSLRDRLTPVAEANGDAP